MDNVGKRFDTLKRQFIGCGPAGRPERAPLGKTVFFWRRVALLRDVFFHFSAKKMANPNGVWGAGKSPFFGCLATDRPAGARASTQNGFFLTPRDPV